MVSRSLVKVEMSARLTQNPKIFRLRRAKYLFFSPAAGWVLLDFFRRAILLKSRKHRETKA